MCPIHVAARLFWRESQLTRSLACCRRRDVRSMNRIPWDRNGHSLAAFHAIAYEEREGRGSYAAAIQKSTWQAQNQNHIEQVALYLGNVLQ